VDFELHGPKKEYAAGLLHFLAIRYNDSANSDFMSCLKVFMETFSERLAYF
jgi:hypothetical protein